MIKVVKKHLRSVLQKAGYDIVPTSMLSKLNEYPPDFDEHVIDIWKQVQPFTMTSCERIYAVCRSIEYIVRNNIPGDVVECGVWKGGSMMAAARVLMEQQVERTMYLFDT